MAGSRLMLDFCSAYHKMMILVTLPIVFYRIKRIILPADRGSPRTAERPRPSAPLLDGFFGDGKMNRLLLCLAALSSTASAEVIMQDNYAQQQQNYSYQAQQYERQGAQALKEIARQERYANQQLEMQQLNQSSPQRKEYSTPRDVPGPESSNADFYAAYVLAALDKANREAAQERESIKNAFMLRPLIPMPSNGDLAIKDNSSILVAYVAETGKKYHGDMVTSQVAFNDGKGWLLSMEYLYGCKSGLLMGETDKKPRLLVENSDMKTLMENVCKKMGVSF